MVDALIEVGVTRVTAHIHPAHAASAAVARACRMAPTEEFDGGERLWEWRSSDATRAAELGQSG